ncbi:TonB-dependent siderophore receptor [Paraglaciecola sp. 2405UD69-4]|uniref:TonB-dependent siderophore receptor n=1 Tax=Paraglaciecola sp. 2405UD69-4 TaxID=3391836 RepID=UPI0039C9702D
MRAKTTFVTIPSFGALCIAMSAFGEVTPDNKEGNESAETEKIEVIGRALSLYQGNSAVFATRTSASIDETPQTIQIITQELIEDQAANEITDLFRSMSGVSYLNYGIVKMRGFEQESQVFYDGVKGDPFRTFTIPQLFNIEQVQTLKGPAGAAYGAGEAGGAINYVTKKPTHEQENNLEVRLGNKGFISGSVESSGPINQDASQRYRLGVYSSTEDSYRDNVEEDNLIVDLGYAWDVSDDSTLTLQYTHFDQLGERLRGVPIDENGNFLTYIAWNSNEPDDDQDFETDIFQANFEHSFNDWLSSNSTFRYYETEEIIKFHQARALVDTDDDGAFDEMTRRYQDQTRIYKGVDLSSYLVAELGKHTIVAGMDYHFASEDEVFYYANGVSNGVSNLSLTNPSYDSDISAYNATLNRDRLTELNQVGIYAQDMWRATDKLTVLVGARVDRFEEDFVDYISTDDNTSYDDIGYSVRVGATYDLNEQFKPYTSISTGLTPQTASDQEDSLDGDLFDPEEAQQFEIGVRSYLLDNRLNVNAALFHIDRENTVTADEDGNTSAIGEVRSQGFEIDALMDITPRWVANISYTYIDVEADEISEDSTVYRILANNPHNQLGLWTRYEFPSISSSIAFGAEYVGERTDRTTTYDAPFTIQPYTIYDLSWQTNWQDWKFQMNIKNLFDKEFALAGFNEVSGAVVGERRRIYLTASYDF